MQETLLNNKSDVVLCNFNPASGYSHSENWTSNGAILETSSLGETITAEFTGKVAAVSSYIFPQGGKYTINIDGVDVYTRDSYTEVANQAGLAYMNLDLEDTKHTLKITTTGASSSAVAGISQKIDYLIVSAPKEDIIVTDFSLAEEFNENELDPNRPYRIGDKVIQIVNNYAQGVFNGETGIVVGYDDKKTLINFNDVIKTYTIDAIKLETQLLACYLLQK